MKPVWVLPALILFATSAIAAKTGSTHKIPADAVGVSGSARGASDNGIQLRYTMGSIGTSSMTTTSTSAYVVTPGIWAGGPSLNGVQVKTTFRFGPSGYQGELVIPSGALTQDYLLYSSTSPASSPLRVSPSIISEARANLDQSLSSFTRPDQDQVWELYLQEEDGRRSSASFQTPGTLTLPFVDDNNDGLLDSGPVPVRVNTLAIWWLDEAHSRWVRLPGSTVNVSSKTVTAAVGHLSVFAVMGGPFMDPGELFAYPVPWRPFGPRAGEGAGNTGTTTGGITFTNLPDMATIRIYSLSGQLVRVLEHRIGPNESFDVRSDSGAILATGTYVYVIDSNGTKKSGKLVVIQ